MLGERIRERLKELRMTQAALANKTGLSQPAIYKLLSGKIKSSTKIVSIAEALQCTPQWLEYGTPEKVEDSELYGIDIWDSKTPLHPDDVELPLFREVELSAGHGKTEVVENHGYRLRFAKSSLSKQSVSPDKAACCFVSGDSMDPVLPDGATVGIDTSQTIVIDGKMYAINYDGMLRVKQLYRVPSGIKIRSINRDYDDEIVTGDDLNLLIILGRVFWGASFY